jgi:NAD(P)-dependent dehydrogenase (short-subunit alcohol dehydrogenase family)
MTLQGRVVLVTGGARRLGRALALAFARRGASVVVTYRTSAREARRVAAELSRAGRPGLAVRADLSRAADVRRVMAAVARRFGRLDVLVNCAANFDRVPFARLTEADWDRALETNLKGPFLCALHASRLMRRGGKIINFADWAGVRPYRDYLPYCVSKAGVLGLTKALAKELAPRIQVTAIAPGPILPPEGLPPSARRRIARRVPLRRWGRPEDIVNAALFLIEGTDFMTGSTIFVDGGQLIA